MPISKKYQKMGMQVINANPNIIGAKSNVPMPKKKPKLKYTDSKSNPTNLKTKDKSSGAIYKAMGGMVKYYADGGYVITGRN
jgi:hypothetical protein